MHRCLVCGHDIDVVRDMRLCYQCGGPSRRKQRINWGVARTIATIKVLSALFAALVMICLVIESSHA